MDLVATFLIFCVAATYNIDYGDGLSTFNVVNFGAKGDGKTDDSKAFMNAWKAVCGASGATATLEIPAGRIFLLKPVDFIGPCKASSVHFQVSGKIIAPSSIVGWGSCDAKCLLCFETVSGLVLDGSGEIDGHGANWWKSGKQSCGPPDKLVHFNNCGNLRLSGISVVNSPRIHVGLHLCNGASISNLKINSPGDSPNTDGIDLSGSTQVHISDSKIASGDDCIAVNGGCTNINITHIKCGPGHGISIGSLGVNGANDHVEEVHVRNCNFTGTQNGARIKTEPGGSGYARKITFEEITLVAAGNPIIIDQNYCNGEFKCPDQPKAVVVSDVTYTGIRGTSSVEQAITLDCAKIGCKNIRMNQIAITSSVAGKQTKALCNNAHGTSSSTAPPVSCLTR